MARTESDSASLETDSLWYKDAIIYQLHPKAFFDSNADGIGDFPGLIEKLDYIQDLGVTAIWVLPFYPSPLRDDGYDIADYEAVHPAYGVTRDVRRLVREAHRRGLQVITELVCNHTSDQHPWFQRARRARPGSAHRNYYVWTEDPNKYREARIIFKDFETSNWTWDPVANAYFWHRFYSHQPDLNFDNPRVRKAILDAMDFWLEMGVDGLRLDAIPYLYEREGTNCENLPETHAFLRELRRHVDRKYPGRMLLAEANQWPEDAVAYFGNGDECNMAFHFPLMPRMFMSLRMEDRYPIIDIMAQTPDIPGNCQWAIFLRNHDELTLEMVTDEERDYMYRVYAHDPQMRINLGIRRRLAPLLSNNRRRIELMNGLLFSMPGTPVIYYGDELGMGDNIYLGDRNGVRTPMQWSNDRNAGFSQASRQQLYLPVIADAEYHYESVNVEAQQQNPHSLLWWMKRLMALRKRYRSFSRGTLEFLHPENRKILAFVRRCEDEQVLVVANLSRFVQAVELDLSEFRGMVPVEMFGRNEFPPIGENPYFLTLGPHAFFWFSVEPQRIEGRLVSETQDAMPMLTVTDEWESLIAGRGRSRLMSVLPSYILGRRWFGGKSRKIKSVQILDSVQIPFGDNLAFLNILQVDYVEGDPETYLLPITCAAGERAAELIQTSPHAIITEVRGRDGQQGILYDAIYEPGFAVALLQTTHGRRRLRGEGEIRGIAMHSLRSMSPSDIVALQPSVGRAEQSNSSVAFENKLILKLYRRLETGTNPDLEMTMFLTEHGFEQTPPVAGSLEYRRERGPASTLALVQKFQPNEGDAWQYTVDALDRFFERTAAMQPVVESVSISTSSLLQLAEQDPPDYFPDLLEGYLEDAHLLGRRTAEMHQTLARGVESGFAPETFNTFYQRSMYQTMRSLTGNVFPILRRTIPRLSDRSQAAGTSVLSCYDEIIRRFRRVIEGRIESQRIRIHGDYHLGQVLFTGRDFVIIDFEGEPARPLSERVRKRSALVDVAGMLRSFHYAAYSALFAEQVSGVIRPEDVEGLEHWARSWNRWVSSRFLRGYFELARTEAFIPSDPDVVATLLDAFLLEKAVYEVGYELNNRPDWVEIPLQGILQLTEE